MSVGISFIGRDGRESSVDLDGLPTAGSELDRLFRGTPFMAPKTGRTKGFPKRRQSAVPEEPKEESGKVKVGESDVLDYLGSKLLPGGGLIVSDGKLCLEGGTGGSESDDPAFYTSRFGSFRFRRVDELDRATSPKGIGGSALAGNEDPDGTTKSPRDRSAFSVFSCTRTAFKMEPLPDGSSMVKISLFEFTREFLFTEFGRCVAVGPEVKRPIGVFLAYDSSSGGGGGNGKYGVRPFWSPSHESPEQPHLESLAFGAEKDLDTWDGSVFKCNYDSEGMVLPDPPVKIVHTAKCEYTESSGEDEG